MGIIIIRKKLIGMSVISTSLTVRGQLSPRVHVEAWLPGGGAGEGGARGGVPPLQ